MARAKCLRGLRKILQERSWETMKSELRWWEPCPDLLNFLHKRADTDSSTRLPLHLSKLQEIEFKPCHLALHAKISRAIYLGMHKDKDGVAKLKTILDSLWHPTMDDKWKKMEFLGQPKRCVFSRAVKPLHQVQLSESLTHLQATLMQHHASPGMHVDRESRHEGTAHQSLLHVRLFGSVQKLRPHSRLGIVLKQLADRFCLERSTPQW